MNDIEYVKKFAPDLIEKLIFRFKILEYISINAPVGRRNIASHLGVGERIVRNELEFFTDEKFIEVIKSGTFITELGESILQELRGLVNNLNENHIIAEELKNKLRIKKVLVCDSYQDEILGREQLAKVASEYFLNIISEKDVIAISGGTTVKSFVDTMSVNKYYNEISVIPKYTWGGLCAYHEVVGISPAPTATIEKLKFEKGNKATDWTPAPEDLQERLNGYEVSANTALPATVVNDTVFANAVVTLGLENIPNKGSVSLIKTFDNGAVSFTCVGKTIVYPNDNIFNGKEGSTAVVSVYNNKCYIRISNV